MIKYSCVTAFYYQGTLSNHLGLVYYVVNHHFFSVLGSVLKPVDADFLTVEAAAFYFSTTNNSPHTNGPSRFCDGTRHFNPPLSAFAPSEWSRSARRRGS